MSVGSPQSIGLSSRGKLSYIVLSFLPTGHRFEAIVDKLGPPWLLVGDLNFHEKYGAN